MAEILFRKRGHKITLKLTRDVRVVDNARITVIVLLARLTVLTDALVLFYYILKCLAEERKQTFRYQFISGYIGNEQFVLLFTAAPR